MLFRGRPNTHTLSRYALSYLSQSGSAAQRRELDVGLVFYLKQYDPFWKANRSITPLRLLGERTMFEHGAHKYLLSLQTCPPVTQPSHSVISRRPGE